VAPLQGGEVLAQRQTGHEEPLPGKIEQTARGEPVKSRLKIGLTGIVHGAMVGGDQPDADA
jgi:hypothetical protein